MSSKLDGIKPGDRVRVECEATVIRVNRMSFTIDLRYDEQPGRDFNMAAKYIERIEPPLKVLDAVQWGAGVQGHIVAIQYPRAWVRSGYSDTVILLSDLERIA